MSPKESPCDDAVLIASLKAQDSFEIAPEVLSHIECCDWCQERLTELAATNQQWDSVKHTLHLYQNESLQLTNAALTVAQPAILWTEEMAKVLLSEPSHPEMLGRLGRYEVERLVGSGGMGIVFKAFDSELHRTVAIKLLAPYLANSGAARKRFSREGRAAAAVVHQHVVPIYNVETEAKLPFIVMQYVQGESLQARINRNGYLELCEILRIGSQIADGLSAAHKQGLIHRDIKPSNILLEESMDRALISDFGLARTVDDASVTHSGFHPGTPQYMSPEQASGAMIDARSDLFSLGSTLYAMCTGRSPFRAETSLAVMRRIAESEPTPIREINPEIPEWLCSIINKLLQKQPENRFASAHELYHLLSDCLSHAQEPLIYPLPTIPHSTNKQLRKKPFRLTKKSFLAATLSALAICLATIPFLSHFSGSQKTPLPSKTITQTIASQVSPSDPTELDQESKLRIRNLIKNGSIVVTGSIGQGVPTGDNFAYIFTPKQVLKGQSTDLTVILSRFKLQQDTDFFDAGTSGLMFPKLAPGEYMLVLRAHEVVMPIRRPYQNGPLKSQVQTFNYFISNDDKQLAAWPIDSPHYRYAMENYIQTQPPFKEETDDK